VNRTCLELFFFRLLPDEAARTLGFFGEMLARRYMPAPRMFVALVGRAGSGTKTTCWARGITCGSVSIEISMGESEKSYIYHL